MALKAKGKSLIERFIMQGTEFKCGNISGVRFDNWADAPKGRLPYAERDRQLAGLSVQVLYSYQTPIAFRFCDVDDRMTGWVLPSVYYSPTTTNHQNVARVVLGDRVEMTRW